MAQDPPPPPEPKKHLFTEEMKEAKEKQREEELRPKRSVFSDATGTDKLVGIGIVVFLIFAFFAWLFGCNSSLFR